MHGNAVSFIFSFLNNFGPYFSRSVAIFRAPRNGVRPISGANNGATAIAFGDPRPSRRALCTAPGLPLDAVSHGLAFRLRRRSRAALRPNLGPTPTRGQRTPLGAYPPPLPCAPPL